MTIIVVISVEIRWTVSFVINALASFVGTVLMMVTIVHRMFLLSKLCQVFHNNILVVKIVGVLVRIFHEFIKSSVENLVPSPSESEDLSDSECDVPTCDDFTTFSNLLFDVNDDFSSSDNESFSDEDILKEIYSNPLFNEEIISIKIDLHQFNVESDLIESLLNHDSSIISSSSKIDSLLDEFAGELILLKSIPSGIDETDYDPEEEIRLIEKLLYDNSSPRPPEEFIFENSDAAIESFSPSPIPIEDSDSFIEEIDLSLTPDYSMPPGVENDDYDSEVMGDDSSIFTIKVMGDITEHDVPMPRLLPTQPTLTSNQEKSLHLLSL
nr:hypothetical protein [Tanacetum cinerariifolium]